MRALATNYLGIRDILLIIVVWCMGIAIVNPVGNFPLVDDWAFGRTVATLLNDGKYDPMDWGYMTLITNVFWGALFCLPSGFSFTALRFSTLVAAIFGIVGVYTLMRDMEVPKGVVALIVVMIAFNPLYYVLSNSFMTDVLFMTLSIWSSIFFMRSLRTGSSRHLYAGTALAVAATLSRQLALCVPTAFAATALLSCGVAPRSAARALIPATVCLAAYLFAYLAGMINVTVESLVVLSLADIRRTLRLMLNTAFSAELHLGLFLLPLLLLRFGTIWRTRRNAVIRIGAISTLLLALMAILREHHGDEVLLPFFGNWLTEWGVGPAVLTDTYLQKLTHMRSLPWAFWAAVTCLAFLGAVLLTIVVSLIAADLVSALRSNGRIKGNELVSSFGLIASAAYLILLLPSPAFFDKYVVPLLPFLAAAIVNSTRQAAVAVPIAPPRPLRFGVFALLASFALFGIVGTRDFMEWNRVRWMALCELMRENSVRAEDIDGGFEFNGYYLYRSLKETGWWGPPFPYQIAFGSVPGYRVLKEYSYQHWLPWHAQKIVVLSRIED